MSSPVMFCDAVTENGEKFLKIMMPVIDFTCAARFLPADIGRNLESTWNSPAPVKRVSIEHLCVHYGYTNQYGLKNVLWLSKNDPNY